MEMEETKTVEFFGGPIPGHVERVSAAAQEVRVGTPSGLYALYAKMSGKLANGAEPFGFVGWAGSRERIFEDSPIVSPAPRPET